MGEFHSRHFLIVGDLLMDYSKLNWIGDFMFSEMYDNETDNDFIVGIYRIKDFPNIILHINIEESKIIEVLLEDE